MDFFLDLKIPMPQSFESPSLTRVGRFHRSILTAALIILPILQAIQWQLWKQDYNMEFLCTVKDGITETSEREEYTSRYLAEYRQKYSSISQRLFLFFVAVNLLIVYLYMSYVWERFNSWLRLKTTKQRGKMLGELKASTAVFTAHSLQLCVRLISSVTFVLYNCVASSVVLPSQTVYKRKQWTPWPFIFGRSSLDTAVHCYCNQAFQLSMLNTTFLTFAAFSGALSLTELVYTWQETKALKRISDYYFCMFLLRYNSVTEATKALIEKELFLEKQRETIQVLMTKKPVNRLPLINSRSNFTLPFIANNIFISQRKLKYKGVKKQKHKQELFRTYSGAKRIPAASLEDLFKPGKDTPNPKKILLSGDPGIGKTEFVSNVIKKFNSGLFSVERDVHGLKFIFSFDFKELDLIDDHITLQELLNYSVISPRLEDIIYQQIVENPHEVLLIFDGLNEWTAKSSMDQTQKVQTEENMSVASLVFKLLSGERLPGSTIVVTSRSTTLHSELGEIVTFDRYAELGSLKPEQVKTYVQEFFCDNKSLSVTINNRISSSENLEVLCCVPQNCLLLCLYLEFVVSRITVEEFQVLGLPSATTGLFERLIEAAIPTEWDQDNPETYPSDHFDFKKNSQEVLEKLSFLAFQGIVQERYVFRKEDLSFVELNAFEVEILEEAGFLRRLKSSSPNQSGIYSFSCLSIQEYLAASRIVQSTTIADFRDFLEKANENHCSTLQFVAGLCKDGKKSKGVFVCLMQHLTEAIKLNSFVGEPVIDNQAIAFLCKCLFENGTQVGHPFAREATSSIAMVTPIAFTEIGANPQRIQAILFCLIEAMGDNVKKVIFESNAIGDSGFRQVASSICDKSCRLDQVSVTSSSITDDGMLSFLEMTARHSFLGLKILGLRGNEISSEGAKYLACVLFSDWCQLEELHLGNNKIGDLGVEYFSEALCSGNSRIEALDLSSNGITHNGIFYLSKALGNPLCNVKRLYLQNNKILDFGMQDLCESLCTGECNLRVLFASSNEITDDGIKFVEKALAHKSCGLQELYLGYNQVTDKGVKSLLQALPNHQFNLKVLSLANNPITDIGVKMLANALRNSSCNLHRLSISLGRAQVTATKASKLQVRYVNAF